MPHVWYPVWQSRRRTRSSSSSLRCCTSATSSSQARRSLLERPTDRSANAHPMGRSDGARRNVAWFARCIAVLYADDSTARSGRGRRCVHGSGARRLRERAARLRAQGARAGAQTTAPFIRARCALRSRHRRATSARPRAAGARLCCASSSFVRCPCVLAAPRALLAAASTARERFGSRRRFASA